MPDIDRSSQDVKRPRTPLDSIRLDKTAFSVISLADADADLKSFWKGQSPLGHVWKHWK